MTIKVLIIGVVFAALAGCSGYIGGDLEDTDTVYMFKNCVITQTDYEIKVNTQAENDYGNQNLFGFITTLTLGIVPTYWFSSENSVTEISRKGSVVYSRTDSSRVHKFYGTIWMFFPLEGKDVLQADEGAGIRVKDGIESRALKKTQLNMPKNIQIENTCIRST